MLLLLGAGGPWLALCDATRLATRTLHA
eukprot:COSAG06_NODE_55329_length_290_cov_0.774869_1_plen_27_part_10